jgi:hypothetical protein
MALTWSGRRQVLYSGVGAVLILVILVVFYQTFFTAPATCFDRKQNGDELGVDCGGSCALLCADMARPPVVLWSRSFETRPGVYSSVAYVQNNNVGSNAGAKSVAYSFTLYDANNILIGHREGTVNIPPVQNVPITETNINVGNSIVSRTLFAFTDDPPAVWNKVPQGGYPQLIITQPTHEADYSKFSAMLLNNTPTPVKNVSVIAILYDQNNTAIETSKSLVPLVNAHSSEPVVFTWPGGVDGVVRSEIIPLASF